jgi:hypothetical protein
MRFFRAPGSYRLDLQHTRTSLPTEAPILRSDLGRGIEADLCYYFDALKLEACAAADALDSDDVADYPNPDVAVEVDLSPSKIDRPGIYRALQEPEVWRLDAGTVSIEQLGADGKYVAAESSRFLHVRADEVTGGYSRRSRSPEDSGGNVFRIGFSPS